MAKDIKIKQSESELKSLLKMIDPLRDHAKDNPELGFNDTFTLFLLFASLLNPQSYGSRIQDRIRKELKGKKVPAKSNQGDVEVNGYYYEVKHSYITTTNNALNLVQVRLWQNVNYFCLWFNPVTTAYSFYELTHDQMAEEMILMKATSAHGTRSANENNSNVELRASLIIDPTNKDFQRWEAKYKSTKLDYLF